MAGLLVAGTSLVAAIVMAAPSVAGEGLPVDDHVTITVLSNRADLVSGGDALVEITLPDDAAGEAVMVRAGPRDVSDAFERPTGSRLVGLVTALPIGDTVVEAVLPDGRGARLTITNHPRGGPVFAGPQLMPWVCTTADNGLGGPVDDQCNAPSRVSYLYRSTGGGGYEAYDPSDPPSDVASTRTDAGLTVPHVVRVETGTIDRSIYRTMVLADPSEPWTAVAPQPAWNGKVMYAFAGGCGTPYRQHPPNPETALFGNSAADGNIIQPELLGRGWMTATSGANSFNQNCNALVSAEAMMMLKEHIVDTSGPILRTVGIGGSGGSVQQHYIASAYPGLLDALVTTQSFPDLQGMTWDTADCALGLRHFLRSPLLWLDLFDQLAVMGKDGPVSCLQFVTFFGDWFDPQNRGLFQLGASIRTGCTLAAGRAYHPTSNPGGPRCSVQDYQANVWGRDARGAAPLPFDNVGVQYGLASLEDGTISVEQFIDLNAGIGGIDNEGRYTSARSAMSAETAAIMYRANQVTDARSLRDVPILDLREPLLDQLPEVLSDMHQPYNTRTTRARLHAANGTHENHVAWFPIPENYDIRGVLGVDRWLDAVAGDASDRSRAEKVIANKPADLVDTCWVNGRPETDSGACAQHYPGVANAGNARIAAGAPVTDDIRKCHLKPLDRSDYRVTFDDRQWAALQAVFPDGVCDWSRPGVGQRPGVPWLTYANGPGGEALGPAPTSRSFRAALTGANAPEPEPSGRLPATGIGAQPWLLVAAAAGAGAMLLRRAIT